jgi:alanyl-tRNA synthetase
MSILEKAIQGLDGKVIPGETVFRLYDTYGFPVDLTADVAREHKLTLDMEGFEKAMSAQKDQARAASNFSSVAKLDISSNDVTEFSGYEKLEDESKVLAIFADTERVEIANKDDEVLLLLDNSPFYGESGGQVGDTGYLKSGGVSFEVLDTQKQGDALLHRGVLREGSIKLGDKLSAVVAEEAREAITLNHSATHLMNSALRGVLGEHVLQKGSLVDADRLRFDFSHSTAVTAAELKQIENQVNAQILANSVVSKEILPIEQAQEKGALALFGEKYGKEVRVVSMGGEYSIEFCGGTHVDRTGDIGLFKIVSESGISSGVRRIEAVTGRGALAFVEREEQTLKQVCDIVKSNADDVLEKVQQLASNNKALEKQLEQLKSKMAASAGSDLASQAEEISGVRVLAAVVEGFNPKTLRDTADQLKNKLGSSVVVLITAAEGKVSIVVSVTKDLVEKVKAGELANMVALQVGGKGGGRPDMAMAGGTDVSAVPTAAASIKPWLEERL